MSHTPQAAHRGFEKSEGYKYKHSSNTEQKDRNVKIVNAYVNGHTLQQVGETFGITRERVRQILKKILRPEDIKLAQKNRLKRREKEREHPCEFCGNTVASTNKYCSKECESVAQVRKGEENRRKRSSDPRLFPGKPIHTLTGDEKRAFQAARTNLWHKENPEQSKLKRKKWLAKNPYIQEIFSQRFLLKQAGLPMIPNPYSDKNIQETLKAMSDYTKVPYENLLHAHAFLLIRVQIKATKNLNKLYELVTGTEPNEEQKSRMKYVYDLLKPLRACQGRPIAKMPEPEVLAVIFEELYALHPAMQLLFAEWTQHVGKYLEARHGGTRS